MSETVVVLGASNKKERYSYKAMINLIKAGHKVIPVHPKLKEIEGVKVINNLSDIKEKVDTITIYVGSDKLKQLIPQIIALKPGRIISNPGTETQELKEAAQEAGINYEETCTLVLLATGQF
jgi:predicted CoA-binding protein